MFLSQIVFTYVIDKDVFARLYQNMLAKRLLFQLSGSDDFEEIMIAKLTVSNNRFTIGNFSYIEY